ncbi:MAG: cyclic nucleotide-binding domain-containing protein [Rhodospirillaceae bacterium]
MTPDSTDLHTLSPNFASSPLLEGLDAAQIDVLRAACLERDYAAGDVILAAGTVSAGVQFVEAGAAEVLAVSAQGGRPVPVAVLGPGQAYGELSALTGGLAISTVRAAATPTHIRTLLLGRLESLSGGHAISNVLMRNIIRVNQQRLSAVNMNYARQLEETLGLLALRTSSARVFILVLTLMSIALLVNYFLARTPGIDVYSPAFAWSMLITLVLPSFILAWREKLPLRTFGITTRNLGRDLAWSAAMTLGVIALAVVVLLAIGYPVAEKVSLKYVIAYGPAYTVHSFFQEIIGRGVMLGMMLRIFDSRTWGQRQISNVAVSTMFALMHIHFGLTTVAVTGVFSLLLGSYYMIYRNVAGPTLIHIVLGLAAFMLGLI